MKKIIISLVLLSQNLLAAEAGRLVLSGQGCGSYKNPGTLPNLSEKFNPAVVPLYFKLEKTSENRVARKACNLAWPIKLGKKEKVQISNIQHDLLFTHQPKTSVKAQLVLFFVGSKQKKNFEAELKASDTAESLQKLWNDDSILLESSCGKDTIFRANFSAHAQGESSAGLESEALKFSIKTVPCE